MTMPTRQPSSSTIGILPMSLFSILSTMERRCVPGFATTGSLVPINSTGVSIFTCPSLGKTSSKDLPLMARGRSESERMATGLPSGSTTGNPFVPGLPEDL